MSLLSIKNRLSRRKDERRRKKFFGRVDIAAESDYTVSENKENYFIDFDDGCQTSLPKKLFWFSDKSQAKRFDARLKIGKATYLQDARIGPFWDQRSVEIGSFCSFGPGVDLRVDGIRGKEQFTTYPLNLIDGSSAVYHEVLDSLKTVFIKIGNDCFIGENSKIMQNVTIGDGVILGARSLVPAGKTLEPFGIYAGQPAKLIGYRYDEAIIEELTRIQWWNWDKQRIVESGLQHLNFVKEKEKALGRLKEL